MLTLTGEVRKIMPDSYVKDGKTIHRYSLILEPDNQAQNYQIQFTPKQCEAKLHAQWEKLKGKRVAVEVSLYVNYEFRFHKYTAVTGQPII